VADNIANLNTTAFKATRTNFGDIMVHSLTVGGSIADQVGTGSRVINIQSMMTQGSFENTDVSTDLAINGAGFFQVSQPASVESTSSSSNIYYTRAGQFLMDKEGYLVNPLGYRLQGFNVDSDGNLEQIVSDLRILTQQVDAIATSTVDLSINLNAEDTNRHHPSEVIDPTEQDTWNYMTTVRVYDSLGIGHDLALLYQRLEAGTYAGPTPSDSASVWKVSVFENSDGTFTANPTYPANTFYMHFDTDGHLVGTSTGSPAYGDMYTSAGTVSATTSNVSDRLGETLTFTGDGNAQAVRTTATVTFGGATSINDYVDIGGTRYTYTAALGAAAAGTWLAEQINSTAASGFYAMDDGAGVVTLYSESSAYDVTASGTNITVDDDTTLAQEISTINNGRTATGSMYVNIAGLVSGASTVTVAGTTFTYNAGVPGANEFNSVAGLQTLIDGLASVSATTTGNNIYITAAAVGTAGNSIAMSTNDATDVVLSSSTLVNGLDDSTTHLVEASAVASGSAYALRLARSDTGSTATITMASSNTLGNNLGVNFDSWTQNQYAADEETPSSIETQGQRTLTYDFPDATPDQEITFDFTPTASSSTTQSAGDNETFYLHQNGSPRGTLQSLSIDETGLISGSFSNGSQRVLGAVILTNFNNPNALERQGDNLYRWTYAAGDPLPATRPGSGGLGYVESGALEQSNVDLANEFVKMINYQRAYQANTRTISTTDDMLAELISLKR
jgi:flagellar hook protein FlgE